jgi:hypothetical protein
MTYKYVVFFGLDTGFIGHLALTTLDYNLMYSGAIANSYNYSLQSTALSPFHTKSVCISHSRQFTTHIEFS